MGLIIRLFLIVLFVNCITAASFSQTDSSQPLKIAVLIPLYLDSAFDKYNYKLEENFIPQYIMSGVDFYNGIMLAVDSLQKEGINLEVSIFDTKSAIRNINATLKDMKPMKFSMIIASLTNSTEQKAVSEFSFHNNIPVISSTYPNDANLVENPFFIMLNPTLKTHVDGLYKMMQNNYARTKPLFITAKGVMEDKIKTYFKANDTTSNGLKYRQKELNFEFLNTVLLSLLDSTKQNIIICGSLNESFAVKLVQTISAAKSYRTTIIGMPNWDGIKQFNKPDCEGVEIIYSTPYNFSRNDRVGTNLTAAYKAKLFSRPSDMMFKGYESMYHFTHLLLQYKEYLIIHLSDPIFKIANEFSIQPVKQNRESLLFDYQENKTLYFVKKMDGRIIVVNKLLN